jgi:hypothetical protein
MTLPRPGLLARRAVQQYRRRDIVPYLGLRYYLDNRSARRERWAEEVAVALASGSDEGAYFAATHFKERDADGNVRHRELYLPGANEALAEAALLAECSNHASFQNAPCVFSYRLAKGSDADGVFSHYISGLQERHRAVAEACRSFEDAVVQYADIQAFYQSVPAKQAREAWEQACHGATLPATMVRLGHRLLDRHFALQAQGEERLLTGPMFSHLIGSLVLKDLDRVMGDRRGARYVRYVDDIILVGPPTAVKAAHDEIGARLSDLGLHLHPPDTAKHLVVDASSWLEGEHDFQDSDGPIQWKTLVGNLKWFLTGAPGRRSGIAARLRDAGFRLPLAEYTADVHEAPYLRRVRSYVGGMWFLRRRRRARKLLQLAISLRERYLREVEGLLERIGTSDGYERKRRLPKLRYRAGRLAYLANRQQLGAIAEELRRVPELEFHATVLAGISSGDATGAARLGMNVVQALAQPMRAEGRTVTFQGPPASPVELLGLGVLALNGVEVAGAGAAFEGDQFLQVARHGATPELMRSNQPFIREFSSLHGLAGGARHARMLESAFDRDEEAVFDAIGQMVFSDSDW